MDRAVHDYLIRVKENAVNKLLINDVTRRTGTAEFLAAPKMTRVRLSQTRTSNTIVSTILISYLVVFVSNRLSQRRLISSQLDLTGCSSS